MNKEQLRRLERARQAGVKRFGVEYVNLGEQSYRLDVVRTGSMMLDYKLGIGGFPYGHAVEVFGAARIGKSSAISYPVAANVQKEGKLPAIIAVEPRLVTPRDREWVRRLGLDPDGVHVLYPDHVEEAFGMLRDLVFGNLVDYIIIDSLGGMGNSSSAQEDGKKKAYGISSDVTAGLNDIMPRLYKNNIGLLILNQQRQQTIAGRPGLIAFESPGGEGLKHHMRIRIHLKPGSTKYNVNIEDESVMVGRELVCKVIKNNMTQGQEKTAKFDFFHIDTEEYGFGIDTTQDVINVGMITGVIRKEGTMGYYHDSFPEGKLSGKPKVNAFLRGNPEGYERIRQGVMAVMIQQELEVTKQKCEALKEQVEIEKEEL
jgi:recombination protein RecA